MYNRLKQPKKWQGIEIIAAFIIIMLTGFSLTSCGVQKHIKIENKIIYRDSLIYKVDTVNVPLPVEKVVEIVPNLDTLYLETSIAQAKAYLDTNANVLRGEIENKRTEIKQDILIKEKISYRDSIVIQEVPVKVPVREKYVPTPLIVLSTVGFLTIFLLILYLLSKIKLH